MTNETMSAHKDYLEFPHHDWKYSSKAFERLALRVPLALDVGCGNGDKTVVHARYAEVFVGGDLNAHALKQALSKGIMAVRFDAHAFPFRSGVFDLVTSFQTIEHFACPNLFLSEVRRVMARGGLAMIITPNRRRANSFLNRILRIFHPSAAAYPMNPDHVHEFDLRELTHLAGACFEDYCARPIGLRIATIELEWLPWLLQGVGDQLVLICRN